MGEFSNIENFTGVKTFQLGWASGDVSLIMSVLDPCFTFTITGQTSKTRDQFPKAYAQFRKQVLDFLLFSFIVSLLFLLRLRMVVAQQDQL